MESKKGGAIFWDSLWGSEKCRNETELIDRAIPNISVEYSYQLLGDIKGKKLLEIGCGSGNQTIEFCQKGAFVTAIDLSAESLKYTKERCTQEKVTSVIVQMSAEALAFKNNIFDKIYVNKVLLHADKDKVFSEFYRVLKKGGVIVINEMLQTWLFSFPYRTFSPYRHSKPKYVTLNQIKSLSIEHKEFYLFSTFFLFLFFINKKIAFAVFNSVAKIDKEILEAFPCMRKYAWITVASFKKLRSEEMYAR